jgi:threonylcarbamoyladenosine tRNA methylthiotransferase CDKAL1
MTHLFHSYRRYEDCRIGERHFVLICELASDGKHYVGHNKFYGKLKGGIYSHSFILEHILVPNDGSNSLLGKWANVQIVEVSKFYMRSKLIEMPTKMDAIMENEQLEINKNSQINEKKEENKFPLIKAAIVGLILFLLFKFLLLAYFL